MRKSSLISIRCSGRLRSVTPSLFTLGNALCGFAAIVLTVESIPSGGGVPASALWFVFLAMLFDVLDGVAARLLDARSVLGMNLDSLADAVSFGVAPALLVYVAGRDAVMQGLPVVMVSLLSSLFLGCTLWRLAVYNSRAMRGLDEGNRLLFSGLPSPAAAAMICSMVWLMAQFENPEPAFVWAYAAYPLSVSLLMVGRTPYPHLRNVTERLSRPAAVAVGLSAAALVGFLGMRGLMILSHAYILSPSMYRLASRCARRAET